MAMWWLDAARYADTDGFQGDATRTNWPWRDWVVAAFNRNQPFDQFTVEQLAGDLLPDATAEQILATCFHRNHMTNGEGGRDPEESRIDYVIDRVNTTGTVWLGLTLGCAQCHTHKFDPISHHDYYSLFAFFNSIDEDGRAGGNAKPYLKYKSPLAERAVDEANRWADHCQQREVAARSRAEQQFSHWLSDQVVRIAAGFTPWQPLSITSLQAVEGTVLSQAADNSIQATGPHPRQDDYQIAGRSELSNITGLRLEVLPHESHTDGKWSRGASGTFILTNVKLQVRRLGESQVREIEIASAIANREDPAKARNYGNVKDTLDDDPRNGWTAPWDASRPDHPFAVFALAEPLTLADDEELIFWMLHRSTDGDANIGRFRLTLTDQPGAAVRSLDKMPLEELAAALGGLGAERADDVRAANSSSSIEDRLGAPLRKRLVEQYLFNHPEYQVAKHRSDRAQRQLTNAKQAAGELNVMVMAERQQPRPTHVLERGVWDQKGELVSARLPAAILPGPAADAATRLDLARWIVDPENPLTPRVVVNHLWQLVFGAGLVRTPEDFGLQGEFPTHPELLDWLAIELMQSGWDLRHLLRMIVTSETYRQSSDVSPQIFELDPQNRLLARGARFRLPSWMIRDAALRTSGLLNPAIGGPPVLPYQPDGVWEEIFMGRLTYEPSPGPAQYRRTLYAFWRRSSAPTFLFDSAQRRVCEVNVARTNTPLQALTLMNDTGMLEASAELARQAIAETDSSAERLTAIFRRILSRLPGADEQDVLSRRLQSAREHYRRVPADAAALLAVGESEFDDSASDPAEIAAYMVLASLIFNTDEAMTHE